MGNKNGSIEVICGSMFSGKSEELIRRIKRAQIAKQSTVVFKPKLDKRYDENDIVTHSGLKTDGIPVDVDEEGTKSIFARLSQMENVDVVGIDEAHFFADNIVEVCETLANRGVRVIVSGLDLDFRGEPFKNVSALMAKAERVDKLQAICMKCGAPASRTQRIINGEPAKCDDPIILIGASEIYEARCRKCHDLTK